MDGLRYALITHLPHNSHHLFFYVLVGVVATNYNLLIYIFFFRRIYSSYRGKKKAPGWVPFLLLCEC